MKVILLQDVKNLGKKWDIKEVSDGYARNFLLPEKLVEMATNSVLKKVDKLKEKEVHLQKEGLEKTQELASVLQGKEIVISAKEKEGKLFGSISAKDIVKVLKKDNILLPTSAIELESPIKEIGEYEIKIKLDHGIETQVSLVIEGTK